MTEEKKTASFSNRCGGVPLGKKMFSEQLFDVLYEFLDPLPKELISIILSYCAITPINSPSYSRGYKAEFSPKDFLVICENPFRVVLWNDRNCLFVNEQKTRILRQDEQVNFFCTSHTPLFQRASDHGFYLLDSFGIDYYDVNPKHDRYLDFRSQWLTPQFILLDENRLVVDDIIIHLHKAGNCVGEITRDTFHVHYNNLFRFKSGLCMSCQKLGLQDLIDVDGNIIQDDIDLTMLYSEFGDPPVSYVEDGHFFHVISPNMAQSFQIDKSGKLIPLADINTPKICTIYNNTPIKINDNQIYIGDNHYTYDWQIYNVQRGRDGLFVLTESRIIHLPNG